MVTLVRCCAVVRNTGSSISRTTSSSEEESLHPFLALTKAPLQGGSTHPSELVLSVSDWEVGNVKFHNVDMAIVYTAQCLNLTVLQMVLLMLRCESRGKLEMVVQNTPTCWHGKQPLMSFTSGSNDQFRG